MRPRDFCWTECLFNGESRDDSPFFVEAVRVADRDAVFSGGFVDQRQQVGFLAVFFSREAEPLQFVGFHTAERTHRGQFGEAFLLVGLEPEDVDDRDRVGCVVHGLDDKADVIIAFETDGGFGSVDDEFRLGLADAEDLGAGIRRVRSRTVSFSSLELLPSGRMVTTSPMKSGSAIWGVCAEIPPRNSPKRAVQKSFFII